MHAANIKNSDRLQRVDDLLADKMPKSTMQIIQAAGVCAVNSIISELRANGRDIHCKRQGSIWYYMRVS
jgi:hypothetical protein